MARIISKPSQPAAALPIRETPQPRPNRSKMTSNPRIAFIIADMQGRDPKKNHICASCHVGLSLTQAAHTNLHNSEDQPCKLCKIMDGNPGAFTEPFMNFINENPTVFHAVDYFKRKLNDTEFVELKGSENWIGTIKPGGRYYITRNGSSFVAFVVGKAYKPGNGVSVVGGHIDALTARLKPVSDKPTKGGYTQLGVAPYAGGLNTTWWDRDLSIGGRVIVRDEETGKTSIKLVKLDWPIAKVPTLAPHFGVGIFGAENAETEAVPIIGLESPDDANTEKLGPAGSWINNQPPKLVKLIAEQLGVKSYGSIVNWELELFDYQGCNLFGLDKELVSAARIDDKLCSWAAFMGLMGTTDREDEGYIKLVAMFDDEEIGSLLRQGAKGNFLPLIIDRTIEALNPDTYGPGVLGQAYAKSFMISADVTHAGNPNFLERYLPEHIPKLNTGVVISSDPNGHMTTDAVSTAVMHRTAELGGCTTQNFQIRNDSRSGGTIGPSLSSMLGLRAADVGIPQLSMHSVRASTGALDPGLGAKFFKSFFDHWEKIDGEWISDE